MTATTVSTRGGRCAVAVLALSLTAVGLSAGVPGAGAVSPSIVYACAYEGPGTFDLPVTLDTDVPSRMTVGQVAQVTATASATLPGTEAKAAYDGLSARSLDGALVSRAAFGLQAATVDEAISRTSLGDQSVLATPVGFAASSTAFAYTAPATPGTVEVTAAGLSGTFRFYDAAGTPVGSKPFTCSAPNGKPPVIDTINVVASSTTALTLDKTTSEYGQDVTATAKVTTSSGTPDGDVAFSVDGVATKARVGKDGVATLLLPDAGAGAHAVTATFVPRDATAYDGSASAAQAWTVTKARTRIRIPVTGLTTKVVTRVGVRAKGVFDTVPTGKVRIKVTRVGRSGKRIKVRTLDATGAAKAGFGTLKRGRYLATVVYRGDANHRYLKKSRKFRVTRG